MPQSVLLKRHIPQASWLAWLITEPEPLGALQLAEGEEKFAAGSKFILVTRSRTDWYGKYSDYKTPDFTRGLKFLWLPE